MPPELEVDFEIEPPEEFDCVFEIYSNTIYWGGINGDIENQTDLQDALDLKADKSEVEDIDERLDAVENTISDYGDIVSHDADEFATAEQGQLANTALQPNDNISELNNNVGYITSITSEDVTNALGYTPYNSSNPNGYQANVIETIEVNNTPQTITSKTVNITVPTQLSDLGTTTQMSAINSGVNASLVGQITTNKNDISLINGKIPSQASSSNQLADKDFVNSSISTNTANFIGTFNSVAELEAYSGTLTNNDYAFVVGVDSEGNTVYDRYKYSDATTPASWIFEYELNNSSFTANQWASINSGANTTNIGQIATNTNDISDINTTISGYGDIVTHDVSEFATAQQGSLADTSLQNGTDVVNALGYTPYNSTNPNNYSSTLNGLTDVDLSSPTQGQNLTYDAVNQKWINSSTTATVGWGGITGTLSDQTDLQNALNGKQNVIDANNKLSASYISGLGAVATSNNYNDLSNKPTIPSAQVNSDWNANSGVAQILNKPTLSTVATSGSYNDLSNKPTIPTDVSDLTNTTLANVGLSNLSSNGENRLYALKGYNDNGQILSDTILYNYIKSIYHSSFDLSKFTVVGTPTITSEGVASGFTTSNYVKTPTITADLSKPFVIEGNFITTSATTQQTLFGTTVTDANNTIRTFALQIYTTGVLYFYCPLSVGGNWIVGTTTLTANTQYYYRLVYDGNGNIKWYYGTDKDNLVEQTAGTLLGSTLNNYITLGIGYGISNPVLGSIDLKQFSITVDGVPVFSGNKTGTDTYYTDDYTVVGNPTIVDGIASGFNYNSGNGDYVTTSPFLQNWGNYDTWSIEIPITMPPTITGTTFDVIMCDNPNTNNGAFLFQVNPSGKIRYTVKASDDTWIELYTNSNDSFSVNEAVTVKYEFTGTQYILYAKKSGQNWVTQHTTNKTKKIKSMNVPLLIGCYPNWRGTIDLWGIKFTGNGRLVYTPKLYVPYHSTNNGVRIADEGYRDYAIMVGDTYGYSPYFTIDTTNQNITLPMPDLYSMIAKSTPEYLKTVSGYNGTATQTLKNINGVLTWVTD